ncbi:MAG TPA: hypothetical protein VIA98_10525 [Allosphingosinicella sp.]
MNTDRLLLAAALLGTAFPAAAQEALPERTTTAIVYGSEACPKAEGDEVVVCARRPERERYRIPKELRHKGDPLSETAWSSRNELLEDAARAGRPGSCSPVGTYGMTGCQSQLVDQWYRERRGKR